jgi:hypothetical protein
MSLIFFFFILIFTKKNLSYQNNGYLCNIKLTKKARRLHTLLFCIFHFTFVEMSFHIKGGTSKQDKPKDRLDFWTKTVVLGTAILRLLHEFVIFVQDL